MSSEFPNSLLMFAAGKKSFYNLCFDLCYVLGQFLVCIRDVVENRGSIVNSAATVGNSISR